MRSLGVFRLGGSFSVAKLGPRMVFGVVLACGATLSSAQVFQLLSPAGNDLSSVASGISGDGRVVVGASENFIDPAAVRWVAGGAPGVIADRSNGRTASANSTNFDGSVVVGGSTSPSGSQAFRWSASTGVVGLGFIPGAPGLFSTAFSVSGNGSVIVGVSDGSISTGATQAFRKVGSAPMQGLGFLGGTTRFSDAFGVSGDGATVVGSSSVDGATSARAFVWRAPGPMVQLSSEVSSAVAVSANGLNIAGARTLGGNPGTFVPAVWRSDTGATWTTVLISTPDCGGVPAEGYATDVSGDGSVVVGWYIACSGVETPFVFDARGLRDLSAVLVAAGADLTGVTLLGGTVSISDDGTRIAANCEISGPTGPVRRAFTASIVAAPDCNYDYNQDENVDLTDAQQMAQVAAGVREPEATWLSGDLNGDENADLSDAQILAQFVTTSNCAL
jgi:uncharacterized membrane protein